MWAFCTSWSKLPGLVDTHSLAGYGVRTDVSGSKYLGGDLFELPPGPCPGWTDGAVRCHM